MIRIWPSLVRRLSRLAKIDSEAWIAPTATVQGRVTMAPRSSLWYNSVIQGSVSVGEDTNIQDGSVVVGDEQAPVEIGIGVTIGHAARLHNCRIGDHCLVGIGSIVTGATMEPRSQLAAGAVLQPGSVVASGQMWAGNPAKYFRDMRPEEIEFLERSAAIYVQNAALHRESQANGSAE